MDCDTLDGHARWAHPLSAADERRLARLKRHPHLADVAGLIDHVLHRTIKPEQEAARVGRKAVLQRFQLAAAYSTSLPLRDDGDAVYLDGGAPQTRLHGGAGRVGLLEVLPVHLVELGKVVEIGQEGADLDHVFPRGAGGLQDGANVAKGQLGLLSKAAQSELAGLWIDWSLSRDIDLGSIPHDGVRVWASWLGTFFGKKSGVDPLGSTPFQPACSSPGDRYTVSARVEGCN